MNLCYGCVVHNFCSMLVLLRSQEHCDDFLVIHALHLCRDFLIFLFQVMIRKVNQAILASYYTS